MLQYILNGGGGNIGRVLIIESNEGSHSIIDEIIETLKKHPEFELLWLKHEPVLSLPGLEIDSAHRKVYCDKLEISLTARNMIFSACSWQIRGVSLPMTRYIGRYGERRLLEMQTVR